MCDYRQADEYCQYFIQKGWGIEKLNDTNALIKKVPMLGNVIKIQRFSTEVTANEIEVFAKKHNAVLVALEPDINTDSNEYNDYENSLVAEGWRDLNIFLSPTKTTCINLSDDEETILSGFDHDIKKSIRLNSNRNIKYERINTIEEFYPILYEAEHRGHVYLQNIKDWKKQWEPFGDQISIITAQVDGMLLGGNMFIVSPPIAYGLFLPVTKAGKTMRISAPLIWEALKISKNRECATFDLNGLYDERYNSPKYWRGLSNFKKKFNGHEVSYMHPKYKTFSNILKPFEHLGLLWTFFTDI